MKTARLKHALLALIVMVVQTGCGGNMIGRGPDGTGTIEPIKQVESK